MDKKLIKECVGAIVEAAIQNKWGIVLDLPLKDVVEQLEETNVKTPEAAVEMFSFWFAHNERENFVAEYNDR